MPVSSAGGGAAGGGGFDEINPLFDIFRRAMSSIDNQGFMILVEKSCKQITNLPLSKVRDALKLNIPNSGSINFLISEFINLVVGEQKSTPFSASMQGRQ